MKMRKISSQYEINYDVQKYKRMGDSHSSFVNGMKIIEAFIVVVLRKCLTRISMLKLAFLSMGKCDLLVTDTWVWQKCIRL